jgi:hypothetical protein
VLSAECFAERYALTLRLMLSNFRRKTGALSTVPGTPRMAQATPGFTLPTLGPGEVGDTAVGDLDGGLASFLNLPNMGGAFDTTATGTGTGGFGAIDWGMGGDGLEGFAWPNEFSPSNLPVWLQDGVSAADALGRYTRPQMTKVAKSAGADAGSSEHGRFGITSRRLRLSVPPTRVSRPRCSATGMCWLMLTLRLL